MDELAVGGNSENKGVFVRLKNVLANGRSNKLIQIMFIALAEIPYTCLGYSISR